MKFRKTKLNAAQLKYPSYALRRRVNHRMILFITLFMHACWMSPETIQNVSSSSDDLSVHALVAPREDGAFSNFISSVYQADPADRQALVDSFMTWVLATSGVPYLEDSTAFFLYRNPGDVIVQVAGDFCDWNPNGQLFSVLPNTDLYFRGFEFENDARLDYKLVIDGNWILDPLNPHRCSGGFGPNSELAMQGYVQPPEIGTYDIPHGSVTSYQFSDTTQGRTRNVSIYLPPDYAENELSYRSIYLLDGSEYISLGFAANVIDYLVAQGQIPPIIAIFTDPTDRMQEYSYDYAFMDMFVHELVPWVDAEYRTMASPEARAIAGVSLGGLTSLLFTLQHPEVFGNCGAYSPAIWFGDIIEQYNQAGYGSAKIYMDAGTYEPSILNSAGDLKDILQADGWDLTWRIWHEGHSWGAWRAHLDESLIKFWPLQATGIDDNY